MLENLKIKLIKIANGAEKYGLCKENTGSFSIKDKSTGYIIITPSKVKREHLTQDNICIIDLDGNSIEVQEEFKPSTEMLLHIEIYKTRKDVRAIMHTHSLYATSFAVANKVIPPITSDSKNYGGYIYVAPYEKSKTIEWAKSAVEPLTKSDACLLQNDGVVVVSEDIDNLLLKGRYVEEVAEIYYKALTLNQFKEPERIKKEDY